MQIEIAIQVDPTLVIIDARRSLIKDETWEPDSVLHEVSALASAARSAGSLYYL